MILSCTQAGLNNNATRQRLQRRGQRTRVPILFSSKARKSPYGKEEDLDDDEEEAVQVVVAGAYRVWQAVEKGERGDNAEWGRGKRHQPWDRGLDQSLVPHTETGT